MLYCVDRRPDFKDFNCGWKKSDVLNFPHINYTTCELPQDGRQLWPKYVGAITSNNENIVQQVGDSTVCV